MHRWAKATSLIMLVASCSHATEHAPVAVPAVAPMPAAGAATVRPDVQFMHDMTAHHGQAIEMSSLIAGRTNNPTLNLLGERITISQNDEIKRMTRWLRARGDSVAMDHEHMTGMAHMPGMLSAEDFARLRAASGRAFERLFLELMIRHHQGALTMVDQLLSKPGAVQDPELYQLANSIDADQRAEIARMQSLLSNLQ